MCLLGEIEDTFYFLNKVTWTNILNIQIQCQGENITHISGNQEQALDRKNELNNFIDLSSHFSK